MKYVFPVILKKDEDKIGVTVPDLPGCFTFGSGVAKHKSRGRRNKFQSNTTRSPQGAFLKTKP